MKTSMEICQTSAPSLTCSQQPDMRFWVKRLIIPCLIHTRRTIPLSLIEQKQ